jgi:glucosyl-3-phosphoglycerate synthase
LSPPSSLRVGAVVAAHDEEATIAQVVRALVRLPGIERVMVVADGCSDRTVEEARSAGAWALVTGRRVGKGPAVQAGFERLLPGVDVVVLVDGDVGETAARAEDLLEAVTSGLLDLAIGDLPMAGGGGFGLVKRMAGALVHRVSGFRPVEPLSGQRAATARCLSQIRPFAPGFGLETAMTIDAVRLGFRVGEIPVAMRHRPTGRTPAGFRHRARQGFDIVRAVLPRAGRVR